MKEATGELSGTVITVVAIAAVAAIFTMVLLPILKQNIALSTACSSAGDGDYASQSDTDCIDCSGGTCTYYEGGTAAAGKCNGGTVKGSKTCN